MFAIVKHSIALGEVVFEGGQRWGSANRRGTIESLVLAAHDGSAG